MLGTVYSVRLFIVLIMCYNTQLYTISSSELPWQLLYSFLTAQIRLSINFHFYEVPDGKRVTNCQAKGIDMLIYHCSDIKHLETGILYYDASVID